MYGNLQILPSPTNDPTTENRNSHQFFQFPRCTPSSFDMTKCIVWNIWEHFANSLPFSKLTRDYRHPKICFCACPDRLTLCAIFFLKILKIFKKPYTLHLVRFAIIYVQFTCVLSRFYNNKKHLGVYSDGLGEFYIPCDHDQMHVLGESLVYHHFLTCFLYTFTHILSVNKINRIQNVMLYTRQVYAASSTWWVYTLF